MPRPPKHVRGSRGNGSKASNKGKLKSEPVEIVKPVFKVRGGTGTVDFEKVLRAKLNKNAKYEDELNALAYVKDAAQVVRVCYLPGHVPEKRPRVSCAEARAILAAYQAVTGDDA